MKTVVEGKVYWYDLGYSGSCVGHHVYDITNESPCSGEIIHNLLCELDGKKVRITVEEVE